jgi:RNA polymerase sigma-70 factor (sigma-E family)
VVDTRLAPRDDFTDFVRSRQRAWLRTAYLLCGNATEAEDLLQVALVKLARHWQRVRRDQPDAYLRRILYRDSISAWRARSRERRSLARLAAQPVPTHDEMAEVGHRLDVERALAALTPKQRALVVLRFIEDRTEREAAELLGVTVGTVKSQTHVALEKLRAALPGVDVPVVSGGER